MRQADARIPYSSQPLETTTNMYQVNIFYQIVYENGNKIVQRTFKCRKIHADYYTFHESIVENEL